MIFCALKRSIFTYGISAWSGAYKTYLNIQVQLITINSLLSADILFNNCNLLNLKQLHAKKNCM